MAEAISVSAAVSGTEKTLSFEAGKLAQLADGAVVARMGDTMLLATATASRSVREGVDFFPLTVDVEERMYAAGKIPGSFFRREGKATDQAILTCRLIDRPLRPSFPEGFRNEVHVVATIFGADQENPHDVLAINAASAALMISGIPFAGPIGAVRIAYTADGQWIPHPTYQEGDLATFELVVAGRARPDGEIAIMMVEAGGTEDAWRHYEDGAPKVTEEVIAGGLEDSKVWIKESIDLQKQLVRDRGPGHDQAAGALRAPGRLRRRRVRAGRRRRHRPHRRGQHHRRQGRARRRHRRRHRRHQGGAGQRVRGPATRRSRPPSSPCTRRSSAGASSRTASASTAAAPPTSGRCRRRSA